MKMVIMGYQYIGRGSEYVKVCCGYDADAQKGLGMMTENVIVPAERWRELNKKVGQEIKIYVNYERKRAYLCKEQP